MCAQTNRHTLQLALCGGGGCGGITYYITLYYINLHYHGILQLALYTANFNIYAPPPSRQLQYGMEVVSYRGRPNHVAFPPSTLQHNNYTDYRT